MNNNSPPPPGGKQAPPPPVPAAAAGQRPAPAEPLENPFAGVSNTALGLVVDSKMAEEAPPGQSQEAVRALTPTELEQLLPSPVWKLRARRLMRWSWPVMILAVAAVSAMVIWGASQPMPAAVISRPAPLVTRPALPAPTPALTAPTTAPEPQRVEPDCTVRVRTIPRGAVVMLGRERLGRTPLASVPVPCGELRLAIAHPRYRPAVRTISATSDTPAAATVRLKRPGAQLQLGSSPPGARFSVNGRPVGQAPTRVTVSRFETVRVEAALPGRRSWRQKVYVRRPVVKVKAKLTPASGR